MIEKVKLFPIERDYFLESPDFLIDRAKFYFKKNKTLKLNSFWLGVSRLRVNNDKLIYLYNGLRGYYEVKTRYLKEPKLMEKKIPLSKKIFINDYLVKKYKYSDLFIYSLNNFNRPTIKLEKENYNNIYYNFPYRLIAYLNKKTEIRNIFEANEEYYYKAKEMRYTTGFKLYRKVRRRGKKLIRSKGLRRLKYFENIAIGFPESYILQHLIYMNYISKQRTKINKISFEKLIFERKKLKGKKYNEFYKNRRRKVKRIFLYKKKLRGKFYKYYKIPRVIRLLFIVSRRKLKGRFYRNYKTPIAMRLFFISSKKYLKRLKSRKKTNKIKRRNNKTSGFNGVKRFGKQFNKKKKRIIKLKKNEKKGTNNLIGRLLARGVSENRLNRMESKSSLKWRKGVKRKRFKITKGKMNSLKFDRKKL